ncbi:MULTISPECIES: hypothetical protein [Bacillus]|uniref:hypothetical protein n=1 Tax=Bacillus TaxID=1386 RepID=UPI0002E508CA|nr:MULTISPECIES: hypothetical protein [Bacillus]
MNTEWASLKQHLVNRRNHLRNTRGKYNGRGCELDLILQKMQELDPTITNEEIYYNGTEFHPYHV